MEKIVKKCKGIPDTPPEEKKQNDLEPTPPPLPADAAPSEPIDVSQSSTSKTPPENEAPLRKISQNLDKAEASSIHGIDKKEFEFIIPKDCKHHFVEFHLTSSNYNKLAPPLSQSLRNMHTIARWRKELRVGSKVDVFCSRSWHSCDVVDVNPWTCEIKVS